MKKAQRAARPARAVEPTLSANDVRQAIAR